MQSTHGIKMEATEFKKENIGYIGPALMPKIKQEFSPKLMPKVGEKISMLQSDWLKYRQEFGPRVMLQKIDPSMFLKFDSNINNNNNNNETDFEMEDEPIGKENY